MTNSTDQLDGGCSCRAVRYRLTCAPMFVHCCHCTWCQRETGSAFALNALIESDRLKVLAGDVAAIDTPTQSGKGQKIMRCLDCRIALWSHYSGAGEALSFVRVGTLDEPGRLHPDVHIFTSTKAPWVALPDDTPAFPEYYRTRELWSQDSLKRRAALKAR